MVHVSAVLLCLFGAVVCANAVPKPISDKRAASAQVLRVCAFNIKTFGRSKMGKPEVADVISQIVQMYDVILIQEIRDSSGESLDTLLRMVSRSLPFAMSCSARLGRTSYKEQYCYFYRTDKLMLLDERQYVEKEVDVYEREPYSALFCPVGHPEFEFALVALHAKPDAAVEEIRALVDVYDDLRSYWPSIENVLVMGDLNADCSYCELTDLQQHAIYDQSYFTWLIDFTEDTTTSSNTDCAYDRFVAIGDQLKSMIIPGSEGVFRFENHFGLSYDEMLAVSDHYPVELEIYYTG